MKKITLFLCCVLLISCQIPMGQTPKEQKPNIFEKEIYFERDSSGIDDYKSLSFNKPNHKTPCHIIIDANTTTDYYIEGWASPPIPLDIELKQDHNFLFSLWGQGKDNASFYFKLYLLRENIETFLFESFKSEYLNVTTCELLWQSRMNEALSLKIGDRIVCKLFLHVEVVGHFSFFCDSKEYPSYMKDPIEKRYFRYDSIMVNGVSSRALLLLTGTFLKTVTAGTDDYMANCYWGIRLWKRDELSVETEISSGEPVAVVSQGSKDYPMLRINYYTPPETPMNPTDNLIVKFYGKFTDTNWSLCGIWHTPQLNASQLDNEVITVRYWTERDILGYPPTLVWKFYYNTALRDSSIEYSITEYEFMNWGLIWAIMGFFMILIIVFFIVTSRRKR